MLLKTKITEDGKLIAPDSEKVRHFLQQNAGQEVIMGFYNIEHRRSQAQLRFFFGVLVDQIYREKLRDAGYTREEVVSLCKKIGLGERTVIHPVSKQAIEIVRGLSDPDIDVLEMIICIWRVQNFMGEIGMEIEPDILISPNEYQQAIEQQKQLERQRYGDNNSSG